MIRSRILVLAAAVAAPISAAEPTADSAVGAWSEDSALLARALQNQTIELTMRGTSVTVMANALPTGQSCAAVLSANGPGNDRRWSRQLRWGDLAWAGTDLAGRAKIAFHDHEGRMATDTLAVHTANPSEFIAASRRMATACRQMRAPTERIKVANLPTERTCYFARLPSLQLVERPASLGQRESRGAVLTVLARETPDGELRLAFSRGVADRSAADDWHDPEIDVSFAHPRLRDLGIVESRVSIDGMPLMTAQSLAVFGETRLLIGLDALKSSVARRRAASFHRRLVTSSRVTLDLLDAKVAVVASLTFDTAPAIAAARAALAASDWSCEGASPAPVPATSWHRTPS